MENERRVQQKAPAGRYALLDELRGLDLVSMCCTMPAGT